MRSGKGGGLCLRGKEKSTEETKKRTRTVKWRVPDGEKKVLGGGSLYVTWSHGFRRQSRLSFRVRIIQDVISLQRKWWWTWAGTPSPLSSCLWHMSGMPCQQDLSADKRLFDAVTMVWVWLLFLLPHERTSWVNGSRTLKSQGSCQVKGSPCQGFVEPLQLCRSEDAE